MISARLIHRVVPYEFEDVVGFLMRVSMANCLLGPSEILGRVSPCSTTGVRISDIPKLAYFTKNTVEEIYQLSGLESRESGVRGWKIGGEWITKAVFTEVRYPKVCPPCLAESPYIRGLWLLSFFRACPFHNLQLLETCPACNKKLTWNRRSPGRCACSFDLRNAFSLRPDRFELSCAQLIAFKSMPIPGLLKNLPLNSLQVDRLTRLSLDGLCKTFWFLGHCVHESNSCSTAHGLRKPRRSRLSNIVENAFNILNGWPRGLERVLEERLGQAFGLSSAAFESALMPMNHYFRESLNEPELIFIASAYEQQVNRLWRSLGKPHHRSIRSKQLVLEFDE